MVCALLSPKPQVPNISRAEYTLLDINEEGFVSICLGCRVATHTHCTWHKHHRIQLVCQRCWAAKVWSFGHACYRGPFPGGCSEL